MFLKDMIGKEINGWKIIKDTKEYLNNWYEPVEYIKQEQPLFNPMKYRNID